MHPALFPRRGLIAALVCCVYSPFAYAQSVLVVEHRGKGAVVRSARGSQPVVEENGKRVTANGNRFAFRKVDEFYPVFIAVRNLKVRTTGLTLVDTGNVINNQFEFKADFVSAYLLDNVFLVLELKFADGNKSLFLHEIGRMEPNRKQSLSLAVPTSFPLGEGNYQFHVFVDGLEVFHSEQPFAFREGMLDRMIAKRASERADGPPQPFIGPPPEYPPKLLKPKTKGSAVVRMRVRSNGAILDPVVVSATDPAFGESALVSIRQWRFLPAMKDGRAVEKLAEMAIDFTPTDTSDAK